MRSLVVSERLSRGRDDGIKNIALAFLREMRRRGDEVLGLSEWEALDDLGVEKFQANRFYLSPGLAAQVRGHRAGGQVLFLFRHVTVCAWG